MSHGNTAAAEDGAMVAEKQHLKLVHHNAQQDTAHGHQHGHAPTDQHNNEDESLDSSGLLSSGTGGQAGNAAGDVPSTADPGPQYPRSRWWMVSLFTLTASLLFADQNVLAPHLTAAAKDLGISEDKRDMYLGGWVAAAFFLVGAPASILIGFLADEYNRRDLLFYVVLIGEGPMILTYWAQTWWQFLILRTLTGIAVGGVFPLVFSLLADLFPISHRSQISGLVQIATAVGIGFGQLFSTLVGAAAGTPGNPNWRLPFVLVAIPNLVVATVMRFTTQDPPRGAMEPALASQYQDESFAYKETISWTKVKKLLRVASNWLCILQGLPGCLPWGMLLTFFNDYLVQDRGLTPNEAAGVIIAFSVGGAGGVITGALAGQWAYNRKKELIVLFMGFPVLLGILPTFFLINADLKALGMGVAVFMSVVAGFVVSLPGPNLRAVIMNVNLPETRGVAMALLSTTEDLGKGLGPMVVALFVGWLGRRGAFNLSTAGWIPCGILLLLPMFTLRKDEELMQAQLAQFKELSEAGARPATPARSINSSGRRRGIGVELTMTSSPAGRPLLARVSDASDTHPHDEEPHHHPSPQAMKVDRSSPHV